VLKGWSYQLLSGIGLLLKGVATYRKLNTNNFAGLSGAS
jgi:hypothetical protein